MFMMLVEHLAKQTMESKIILQPEDMKLWTLMKALQAVGVFDVRFGKVSIDFDGQGRISNVKIEKNFRVLDLSTP